MENNGTEEFRDHLYNTDETGRRIGFFPKKPSGRFYNRRTALSVLLLILFMGAPWLKWQGEQFMLFNVLERKFVVFGQVFWPQDFLLFVLAFVSFIVFIILFTVVFGRLWCGWACPQTIFLEMVFRKIEFLIEGDAPAQKRLDKAPWDGSKIIKRGFKHSIFLFISFLVGNTTLAYLVGADHLLQYITHSPGANLGTFVVLLIFSLIFYFVFAFFRERACIFVCPYGRLQGVLLDQHSVVINYDHVRGEPRGKISKKANAEGTSRGHCVDCALCVAVCPTGIDIRNGTQLECVNCTACIDACDEVMDKVGHPRGLVRYASMDQINSGKPFSLTWRAKAYMMVLSALLIFSGVMLFTRSDIQVTVLRAPGQTFTQNAAGEITNLYTLKMINKTHEEKELTISLDGSPGRLELIGGSSIKIAGGQSFSGAFLVAIPPENLKSRSTSLNIQIMEGGKAISHISTNFIGPVHH